MFYLTTHSTHGAQLIRVGVGVCGIMNVRGITRCVPVLLRKEGNVLFNDTFDTFNTWSSAIAV